MALSSKVHDYNSLLFTAGLEHQEALDSSGNVSSEFRQVFRKHGISVSNVAALSVQSQGNRWLIDDKSKGKTYVVVRKGDRLDVHQNLHVVNQVVDRDLCVRCGACEPACPVDIIKFNEQSYPYITHEEECITTCTRCLKVCPGEVVDFSSWDREFFGAQPHPESISGIARRALVSYSTDSDLRYEGTSGGFVTQLLGYMLEKGLIDGALVLGTSAESGSWRQQPFIARSVEELKGAVKSKYMVVPFLQPLGEMEKIEGNYAVVALPCYVHALRKYQKVSKKLRERIKLVIGLYCNVVFEPHLLDDACEFNGLKKEDVVDLHFRYGEWPGGVWAEMRDGSNRKVLKLEEMKDEFNLLKRFYTAPRCNMCIDFSAEYADLAVGDPWLRGPDGNYLFEDGRTTVLVRTEAADQIIDRAAGDGYINITEIPMKTYMMNFETNARYKRDFVPKNLLMRQMVGLPVPHYNRPLGRGKASSTLSMLCNTAVLAMSKHKWFRRIGVSLAQLQPVISYLAWNRGRKRDKFARAYPKIEKFIEKLVPRKFNS